MIAVDYDVIGKIYLPAIHARTRYVFNEGGTRSGKTYTTNQAFFHIAAQASKPTIFSIVSETMPHLRKGAMRDFFNFLKGNYLYQPSKHNKTENIYEVGKSIIEFFSADSSDKVHGPERDYLFLNELQNIPYEIFFHLAQRTRVRVYADWNPTHEFYVHTKIINNEAYKDDITYTHSTIFDNPFASEAIKTEVIRRAEHDEHYRTVYLEGKIGRLEGLVFPSVQMVDTFPEGVQTYYGLDFGYSNDPTALVKIGVDRDKIYFDELIYQTGLTNPDIVRLMEQAGVRKHYDEVFADNAEPKSIQEIYLSGFNVKPAAKGKDSINAGIDKIKQHDIYVTKRSVNLMREFRNYTWVTDKEGRATNKPIDAYNHGIDAIRYGIEQLYKTPTVRVVRPQRNDKHRT